MLKITNYVRAQSLEEAYALCQKPRNVILGGMLWLKMQNRTVNTAIDLCDLGLDQIEEAPDSFCIGAMVSLRALETHPGLAALTQGAMASAVKHIVGVQFRNVATLGGSLFGRFGFSDVLTVFMALDAKVELYHRGVMSIAEFADLPRGTRDVLVRVILPKNNAKTLYLSQRNTATDFPTLAVCLSRQGEKLRLAVGARPNKAVLLEEVLPVDAQAIAKKLCFGSDLRASEEYRRRVCAVLVRRGLEALQEV